MQNKITKQQAIVRKLAAQADELHTKALHGGSWAVYKLASDELVLAEEKLARLQA